MTAVDAEDTANAGAPRIPADPEREILTCLRHGPVRVVADRAERTASVLSAGGHRIEGLTLQEAVAVLRALG